MKSNYNKALKILYLIFGSFAFISYFSYLVKLLIWKEPTQNYVIAIIGCLITLVPVAFRGFFEKHLPNKVFKFLEKLFVYGMGFYTVTFIALVIYIFSAQAKNTEIEDIEPDSVIVVFGAGLRGDKPGAVLRKRLNAAIEILEEKEDAVCIVTGCKGENETTSEAYAMREYLIENGIDEKRIYIEDKARNSIENIDFSLEIAEEISPNSRVVLVSNAFHMPRIMLIADSMSVDCDYVFAENNSYSLYSALVREYMAYVKFIIFRAA